MDVQPLPPCLEGPRDCYIDSELGVERLGCSSETEDEIYTQEDGNDQECCQEYPSVLVRPRMNYTLNRTGTTRSDVKSTLVS
ncbi:hypothetical protein Taro_046444 [Colocasia esculenta]|uniref:Uncharacterized protein n=1 Tax=Colocasia esculenta TaxID=4460 RepID=A0A843WTT2_COLES|nr:hypothetical protein [Colocasia esculenta]